MSDTIDTSMTETSDATTTAVESTKLNRRSSLQRLGSLLVGTGALGASLMLPACGDDDDDNGGGNGGPSDADILNFALNLEYLEAEFYSYATRGRGIDDGLTGAGRNHGPTTGPDNPVPFQDPVVRAVAEELYEDEVDHVRYLREQLGSAAVVKPAIDLTVLGVGFGSEAEFLIVARAFEDLGVSAYGGAAPLISSAGTLGAAARILAAEAYHAGNIRLLVSQKGINVGGAPAHPLDSMDIYPPGSTGQPTAYFPTNNDGLTTIRTPAQVLAIAGAFFPNGVNGTIGNS